MLYLLFFLRCLKSCPEKLQPRLSIAFSQKFIAMMINRHDLRKTEHLFKTVYEYSELFPDCISTFILKMMMHLEMQFRASLKILV